ncbi:hypothetical protein [Desulfonatronospira sp.]|uniref:hypothetical protein n=1 Tax=Desulfonatronospira sp. TaxID=1962951 RepID=UPI0025BB227E|nr:hypothetical protein [Desulfonatronospira sp.]
MLAWDTRSPGEQKRVAFFLLFAAVLLPVILWSWISSAASDVLQDTRNIKARYERALPLAAEIGKSMELESESIAHLSPLAGIQKVIRDAGLEDRLASLRPSSNSTAQDGVQLYLERLDLIELLYFFETLSNISDLNIVSCRLDRRMDSPEHMDVRLVLSR